MSDPSIETVLGDVTAEFERAVLEHGIVAWDIETGGLDWQHDQIGTCQLHTPATGTAIVKIGNQVPNRLAYLLESTHVTKIFHHAAFDLRFMSYQWNVSAKNIACTKILSKILRPGVDNAEHSLKQVLSHYLNVEIDKTQQRSDWLQQNLNDAQIDYAAQDVQFLIPLLRVLGDTARANGLADIVDRTFDYIPVRVATDIRGCGDVFHY